MALVHVPVWSVGAAVLTGLQLLGAFGGVGELTGGNAGYSKFANPEKKFKVSSRFGMVMLYAPACAVGMYYMTTAPTSGSGNGRELATAALVTLHFAKRVLECLFLHKYSGTMDGDMMIPISISYSLTSFTIASLQRQVPGYPAAVDGYMYAGGLALFVVGQLGNLYHHSLLAGLRGGKKSDGSAKYVIPEGGFFRFVTMPHYFFELVAWSGVACVAQQLNAFLALLGMTSYLACRSYATTRWYREKFSNYPAERKHLFPFLF